VLATALTPRQWQVSDVECWRDGGWVVYCKKGESELQIVLTPVYENTWGLQIAPRRSSLFGRFTDRPSATPDEVYHLALDVHEELSKVESFASPHWCWDNFPDGKHSYPVPQLAPG